MAEIPSLLLLAVTVLLLLLRPFGTRESTWAALGAAIAIAAGWISPREIGGLLLEIAPVLGFLVGITVVAALAAQAGVFRVFGLSLARAAGGSRLRLFVGYFTFAVLVTWVLSLDATAVLLTPVAVAVARAARVPLRPLALGTIFAANATSLLLPMSNLTNLLVAQRADLHLFAFARIMALPAFATALATGAWIGFLYRHEITGSCVVPPATEASGGARYRLNRNCVLLLLPAFVLGSVFGVRAPVVALGAAASMLLLHGWHGYRVEGRAALVPWNLVTMFVGLYVLVAAAHDHGLAGDLRRLLAPHAGAAFGDLLVTAGATALLANLTNNLPAFLALAPEAGGHQLFAVLIGANTGSGVTPIGSLATLLFFDVLRREGAEYLPGWLAWMRTSLLLTVPVLLVAVLALYASPG